MLPEHLPSVPYSHTPLGGSGIFDKIESNTSSPLLVAVD